MTFNFSTCEKGTPQIEEVTEHLQDLADAVEAYPESVEGWAAEHGLDPDLPTTPQKYAWAKSIANDFRWLQSGEASS